MAPFSVNTREKISNHMHGFPVLLFRMFRVIRGLKLRFILFSVSLAASSGRITTRRNYLQDAKFGRLPSESVVKIPKSLAPAIDVSEELTFLIRNETTCCGQSDETIFFKSFKCSY